ncbi:MAG: peroxiredoxin [Phycisphaerae bacterium]|nr:MAG: peroxiredoxin [Phycisphaerae bacterium]
MRNSLTPRATPPAVGEIIPDFTLPTQDRKDWRLSDAVKAGDVALCFVPFAFTGVCSTEMKCISDDVKTWSGKGATVVGVNCDSMFVNKQWAEKEGYTHTILADLHRDVVKGLGLHWADMNVSQRATIVVGKNADGVAKVKYVQTREPGKAMNWNDLLAML